MTYRPLLLAAAAVSALSLSACNRSTDTSSASTNTTTADNTTRSPNSGPGAGVATASNDANTFAAAVASSDMYEIKAAEIAKKRSIDPQITDFAAMMAADHDATTRELKDIAQHQGIALPTDLDQRRTGMLDKLRSAPDMDFDRTYTGQQVDAHKEALELLKNYADHGGNPALERFAQNTTDKVQQHRDAAVRLNRRDIPIRQ